MYAEKPGGAVVWERGKRSRGRVTEITEEREQGELF
jgi:hypothetical protein